MRPCCLDNNHRNGQSQFSLSHSPLAQHGIVYIFRNVCIYYLFLFCLIANHARVHRPFARLLARSFDTHICCKLFFSLLDQFVFVVIECWCRCSCCSWWICDPSWFDDRLNFDALVQRTIRERERKMMRIICTRQYYFVSFFIHFCRPIQASAFIRRLPFVAVLSVNDNYVFDEIYNFEKLTFQQPTNMQMVFYACKNNHLLNGSSVNRYLCARSIVSIFRIPPHLHSTQSIHQQFLVLQTDLDGSSNSRGSNHSSHIECMMIQCK